MNTIAISVQDDCWKYIRQDYTDKNKLSIAGDYISAAVELEGKARRRSTPLADKLENILNFTAVSRLQSNSFDHLYYYYYYD